MLLTKERALEELPQCAAIIRNAIHLERNEDEYIIHEKVIDNVISDSGWEVKTNVWCIKRVGNILITDVVECPF